MGRLPGSPQLILVACSTRRPHRGSGLGRPTCAAIQRSSRSQWRAGMCRRQAWGGRRARSGWCTITNTAARAAGWNVPSLKRHSCFWGPSRWLWVASAHWMSGQSRVSVWNIQCATVLRPKTEDYCSLPHTAGSRVSIFRSGESSSSYNPITHQHTQYQAGSQFHLRQQPGPLQHPHPHVHNTGQRRRMNAGGWY